MNSEIYINISNSPAHKVVEKQITAYFNTDLLIYSNILNVGDENHHKACRILALVLENSSILSRIIFRYFAFLSRFTNKAPCVLFLLSAYP
jgi:hypothetical protein